MLEYENYHCHSMYSNCLTQPDSTMSIEDYAKVYKERGQRVLCISEHGNRSNVWKQAEVAAKYEQVPLAAAECYFVPDRNIELKDSRNFHLILIAQDQEGFYQLNSALSEANLTGFYYKARVDFDILSRLDYRHFVCTTACVAGPVRDENGRNYVAQLKEIFRENFYLEVQHHPQKIQIEHNAKILKLYKELKVPLIYATDSHYIRHEDAILRKELLLSSGINNDYEDEFDLYLPTAQEAYNMMIAQNVLSRAQIEEAMENTLRLREFPGVAFTTERKFPISRPELSLEQRNRLYKKMVCDGYIERAGMPSKEEAAELHKEMDTIVETNSADYFIGLHDMLTLGIKKGGVLTTTSRGSACGFATNYGLGFTSINRLKSKVRMFPERFISAEKLRVAMPDIDSNISNLEAFEDAGKEIFGEYGCLPMVAFGTCKTLSAFKLLARARNIDFEVSNEISKQIQAYEQEVKFAKESNQDDPDYNVDDYVHIEDYVDKKYISLIDDSASYKGIVINISPHPCGHIVYHKDLRREIGVIRSKAKTGSKKPVYCAYIDGATADAAGYCKSDLLRVDVVKTISDTFAMVGKPVISVDQLLKETENDPAVWNILANGFTMGCNQTEQAKTTERIKQFKPKNIVELSAFVAAIRPGAKSLVNGFVARSPHNYGIPAMDQLLKLDGATSVTGRSAFLFYDEQVMILAQAAGIDPADAYSLIKHIKKKHHAEVAAYKNKFIPGFISYLAKEQGASAELAEKTANDVWEVIVASASYLFNASHAYAVACDCLYGCYLKRHYPYEFYVTLLKLYTEKGNKEKIAAISKEMNDYLGITVMSGRFGQDNRDWYIDKENKIISQNLNSIKFVSSYVATDLYNLSKNEYAFFTDLLYDILMKTKIDSRQIDVLIALDYFAPFGKSQKLQTVHKEFREGSNKLTKTLVKKTVEKRLDELRKMEESLPDESIPLSNKLKAEKEYIGRCVSYDCDRGYGKYFIEEIDDQYGIKIKLYNMGKGTTGVMKMSKTVFQKKPLEVGQCITFGKGDCQERQRYSYHDGQRFPIDGVKDWWIQNYTLIKGEAA